MKPTESKSFPRRTLLTGVALLAATQPAWAMRW